MDLEEMGFEHLGWAHLYCIMLSRIRVIYDLKDGFWI
jgi:hypothetical protein